MKRLFLLFLVVFHITALAGIRLKDGGLITEGDSEAKLAKLGEYINKVPRETRYETDAQGVTHAVKVYEYTYKADGVYYTITVANGRILTISWSR